MNDCTTAWPRIWSLPKRRTLRVLLYIGHCPEACVAQDMVDVRLQPLHLLFSNATILLNMVFLQFSTMLYYFKFHHFHNDFIFLIFSTLFLHIPIMVVGFSQFLVRISMIFQNFFFPFSDHFPNFSQPFSVPLLALKGRRFTSGGGWSPLSLARRPAAQRNA